MSAGGERYRDYIEVGPPGAMALRTRQLSADKDGPVTSEGQLVVTPAPEPEPEPGDDR